MASKAVTYASRRRVAAEALAVALAFALAAACSSACVPPREPSDTMFWENRNYVNSLVFLIMPFQDMSQISPVCNFPTIT